MKISTFALLFLLSVPLAFAGSNYGTPYSFTTLAGSSPFNSPYDVAVDSSGNTYVADTENHTIRKITRDGIVTTLAGLTGSLGSTDGQGSVARFNEPTGIAVDSKGIVYVADTQNHTIRKISPTGLVTTLAGLAGSSDWINGKGSVARFHNPSGLTVDASGTVFVADMGNQVIRKISSAGIVSNVKTDAGVTVRFKQPLDVAVDAQGTLYVADYGNFTICKITAKGLVSVLAGQAGQRGSQDGTGSAARFDLPASLAVDGNGNVYVADLLNNTIRKIDSTGRVTTFAGLAQAPGSSDGKGSAARFYKPDGIAVDSTGNLYVADGGNSMIRKITSAGTVSTLVAHGHVDGTTMPARFNKPGGVATDLQGNVYVADTYNHTIRKITPLGAVSLLAGQEGLSGTYNGTGKAARFNYPQGLTSDAGGNVYVADGLNSTIRKITPTGAVTTLAGSGTGAVGSVDGKGTSARFYWPSGVAVDASGNVYVADFSNSTIRKITPSGIVTTFAGAAKVPGSADGIRSAARFNYPNGVAVDAHGVVYVSDGHNNTIRKITPAGLVSTLAGQAGTTGSDDGLGNAARFSDPSGIAVDANGSVYVTDRANSTIRKISPAGVVTTLGGLEKINDYSEGAGNLTRFNSPYGVAVNGRGTLYIADFGNNLVRVGTPPPAPVVTSSRTIRGSVNVPLSYQASASPLPMGYTLTGTLPGDLTFSTTTGLLAGTPTEGGTYVVTLKASNDAGSGTASLTLIIAPARQTITFPAVGKVAVGQTVILTATTTSGLPITYTASSATAVISGNKVTFTAAGTIKVTASQAGNGSYVAARPVSLNVQAR